MFAELAAEAAKDGAEPTRCRWDASRPASDRMHWINAACTRYAVYLLFPDGRIEAVDLGAAAEIDAAVQAFSRGLRTVPLPVSPAGEKEGEACQLSALIFDPIAPYLADREHLLISPDSQLNRIPFEALQTEADSDYLLQRYQISYLTSGRDLLKLETTTPSTAPALILANPNYDTADATAQVASSNDRRSAKLSQLQVGPLPGTAAEAEAIAPLLPNATILTEDQATENALKAAQAPRILHIATHGFFLADVERSEETQNWLAARSVETSFPPADMSIENPLLRSGLALAGFNARSGSEDGVLTALEVANLNLFGTQLVVLSACETGLGDIANGEGVYGLRRTFAIAGAESQLMSLWLVSDDGTQALMARYYEKLMSGMGRSEALRATQLEMITEGGTYSHPYYWASFILAGDWRPLE
ncbi:MAG: CHAT domain-containing protein [Leptolyngbyaceae cyanobacterium]